MDIHERLVAEYDAFLFGSRSKGLETEDSDWDYAIEYNWVTQHALSLQGWEFKPFSEDYRDSLTVGVSTNPAYPEIQIIFKMNLPFFRIMWNDISKEEYRDHVWKHSPKFEGMDMTEVKHCIMEYLNERIENFQPYVDNEVI